MLIDVDRTLNIDKLVIRRGGILGGDEYVEIRLTSEGYTASYRIYADPNRKDEYDDKYAELKIRDIES